MQIGRNIYYDIANGNIIIDTGERQGSVAETTTEEDFEAYAQLAERVPETVGKISLEFGELRDDFMTSSSYRVNLETLELEFDYTEPEEPPIFEKPMSDRVAELENIIDILVGGENE